MPIRDDFLNEQLLKITQVQPWYILDAEFLSVLHFCHSISATPLLEVTIMGQLRLLGRFSVPKALISDQGTHFCNRVISSLLEKYGVLNKIATPYHPQTNVQAEVFNREIKKILQKMANPNRKDWS
ncbi:Pro-Pol polyprotein, partial [Mucuna pruriens]